MKLQKAKQHQKVKKEVTLQGMGSPFKLSRYLSEYLNKELSGFRSVKLNTYPLLCYCRGGQHWIKMETFKMS